DDKDERVTDFDPGLGISTHRVVAVLARHRNQYAAALVLPRKPFDESRNDLRQAECDRLPGTEGLVEFLAGPPVDSVVVDLDTLALSHNRAVGGIKNLCPGLVDGP